MDFHVASAASRALDARERYEDAQEAAQEALTVWMERHLAELAERFPKRRFEANSGNGSIGVDITPGPHPDYPHHPRGTYSWSWNTMIGRDNYWAFLWQEWEDVFDEFSRVTGLDYINFTRDIDIKGRDYKGT